MLTSRSEPKKFKSFRASSYWLYLHSVNEKRDGGKGRGKQLNKEMDHSWSLLNRIWNGQNQRKRRRRRRAYLHETKEQNEGRRRRRESAPSSRGSSLHTRSKTLLCTSLSRSLPFSFLSATAFRWMKFVERTSFGPSNGWTLLLLAKKILGCESLQANKKWDMDMQNTQTIVQEDVKTAKKIFSVIAEALIYNNNVVFFLCNTTNSIVLLLSMSLQV